MKTGSHSDDSASLRTSEERLRQNEERYRLAITGSEVAVWECDRELRFTHVENSRPPITDPSLILGKRDDEILPYESVREIIELKKRVLATGVGERTEIRVPFGSAFYWFNFVCAPVTDTTGTITGLRGLVVDVTRRRNSEETLEATRAALSQEAAALARLNNAFSRLWQVTELKEGLDEMLDATIEMLGASMGNIRLLADDRGVLVIAAQRGFKREFLDFFREVSIEDRSECGLALRSRERVIVEDVEIDAAYAPFRQIARDAGYRSVQSTPLLSRDGKPLGMLSTHWEMVRRLTMWYLRLQPKRSRSSGEFSSRSRRCSLSCTATPR